MSSDIRIKKKYLGDGQVDGSKIKLLEGQSLKGTNSLGQEVDIIKLDEDGKIQVVGNEVAYKAALETEKERIDAILDAADADKDSFVEIVQLINSIDTENDQAFAGYVLSNNEALAQEISTREANDQQFAQALSGVGSSLTTETLNRIDADNVLSLQIDGVSQNLSTETSQRELGDSQLSIQISTLESSLSQQIESSSLAIDSRIDSLIFQTSHVFIDPVNGVDEEVVGRGSQLKPFQSLGYAYSKVPSADGNYTVWAAQKIIFNLAPGSYSENVTLGFKRARVAISGTGVIFTGDVTVKSVRSDYPGSGSTFNRNLLPAPWTGAFPSPTFELMGVGAGTEGAFVADSMIFTKTIRFEQESAGNINWQAVIGSHFIALSKVQLQNGLHVTHQNPGLGSTYTAEIDGCSISNGNIGVVPYASGESLSSSMQLNIKAHSSQLNSTMGPRLTIQKLDSCRVGSIDVTLGGVYSGNTNASIRTVDNESTSGIVNCSFNGSTYKIGQAAGAGTITYKMDAASFGSLSSKTLDLGSGTVAYNLVDKASGVAASTAPVNYTRSASTVEASLVGIDSRLGSLAATAASLEAKGFSKGSVTVGAVLTHVDLDKVYSTLLSVSVYRLAIHEGEDYTVSVVDGKTRLTFIGSFLAPNGAEAIEEGDKIFYSGAF